MTLKTHRAPVYARHGIVAASQPLAVSAGLEILQRGGSAIDAAIATSAVLAVVEPGASHLGGDAFVITYQADSQSTLAFNGSGEAPHQATPAAYSHGIPLHGYKSATVPGLVSTWFEAHGRYGILPFEELLQAAIDYAKSGFPANRGFVRRIENHRKNFPDTTLFQDLEIPKDLEIGQSVSQDNLARSLLAIAEEGRSAFYQGWIAEQLIEGSQGWFSSGDLAAHRTRVVAPLSLPYRDIIVHGQPPPSQGMILMEELRLADGMDLASMNEIDRIHFMVEAKKIAFEDRYAVLGDPEHVDIDLDSIFSEAHISRRRSEISGERANVTKKQYPKEGSDTTYFLVADRDGNAVSWIQSVFHGFGASWAIPNTGIILNNRLTGFSLDSQSPNLIAPGKRPAHTLNAWIATRKDNSLALVGGTPGANIQVQTNFQLIVNAIDLGMNPQQNAEAPRWQHLTQDSSSEIENFDGVLQIENRVDPEILDGLRAKGHQVTELSEFGHGSAVQLLEVTPDGTYIAGSDPRAEGHAAGI
ncbi:MAG: hypothetical protein RLZZ251_655 [Actinomycetota bacterium]|jgi:gamma-glutamyltranspeptidase/glutathione hydrolase